MLIYIIGALIFLLIISFGYLTLKNFNSDIKDLNSFINTEENKDGYFSIVSFDIREYKNTNDYQNFIINYFKKLTKSIDKAQDEIIIFDYLAHHNHIKSLRSIMKDSAFIEKLYNSYFETLEKALKRGVKYTRVMQLPLDSSKELNIQNQMRLFLKLVLRETISHIDKIHDNSNFSLYILKDAIRPYSFMIIDEKSFICEYDRYDKDRHPLPDLLFIDNFIDDGDNKNLELKNFIIKQKHLIDRILDKNPEAKNLSNPKKKISKSQLFIAKTQLLNLNKGNISEIKNLITLIETDYEKYYDYIFTEYIKDNLNSLKGDTKTIEDVVNKCKEIILQTNEISLNSVINTELLHNYFLKRLDALEKNQNSILKKI